MEKHPCVYLLASDRNGTLYCGVTSDLVQRSHQHREHLVAGFTHRYGVTRLVWYEQHPTDGIGDHPREADKALESGVETASHRRYEPFLARFVAGYHRANATCKRP